MKLNNNWIVVCLISHDSPYELEFAQHLLPSLQKFNIPYHIEVIDNKGSWLKNVAQKPGAIYNAMEKYPNKDIVCLDADCEIVSYPLLFDTIPEEIDIAFHILDWDSWYNYNNHIKEYLSGTVFLKNNNKMKKFVEDWYFEANNSLIWEQKIMEKLLKERIDIKIFELPLSYCYINSLPNNLSPHVKCDNIVIQHYQASRRFKKIIK